VAVVCLDPRIPCRNLAAERHSTFGPAHRRSSKL
jgi:hypothetical protein